MRNWREFFIAPASPRPLAVLRIALSVTLLLQGFLIAREVLDFYGRSGVIQGALNDYFTGAAVRGLPRVSWVTGLLRPVGVGEAAAVRGIFLLYLGALAYLLLGYRTRVAAVTVWLTHSILLNTGYFFSYGAVRFAEIALFYLIFMPCGEALSLDSLERRVTPTSWARLSLRVLQFHLCIAYLATAIAKGQGAQWWNGEAVWRAAMLPHFRQFDMSWLAFHPLLARIACWGTLLVEGGYPVFIWPRATRKLWVALTISLHLGIALILGLVTFSMVMMTLTLCAFGLPADDSWLLSPRSDRRFGFLFPVRVKRTPAAIT